MKEDLSQTRRSRRVDTDTSAMEPKQDLVDTLPPDWKWGALFAPPAPLEHQWRVWLAAAQKAEEDSLLVYWAKRRPS